MDESNMDSSVTRREITKEQAQSIIRNRRFWESRPYLLLNNEGKTLVANWISRVANDPDNPSRDRCYWHSMASRNAIEASWKGHLAPITLEMLSRHTLSGNIERLTLDPECFDWNMPAPHDLTPEEILGAIFGVLAMVGLLVALSFGFVF